MRTVDVRKVRERDALRSDVEDIAARLSNNLGSMRALMSELGYTAAGAPSGTGEQMAGDCQRAIWQVEIALRELELCKGDIDAMDVYSEVDDD